MHTEIYDHSSLNLTVLRFGRHMTNHMGVTCLSFWMDNNFGDNVWSRDRSTIIVKSVVVKETFVFSNQLAGGCLRLLLKPQSHKPRDLPLAACRSRP